MTCLFTSRQHNFGRAQNSSLTVTRRPGKSILPNVRTSAAACVVALASFGLVGAQAQAFLEGKVALPKSHHAPVKAERYDIVSKAGILSTDPPRAVVYLEGDFPRADEPGTSRVVAQKDFAFVPPLLPIQTGTRVSFPNLDDTYHNIFSYSPPKRFDLGRYPPGEKPVPSQVFDQAGLVTLRCDIHDYMRGLILVLDSPYFTVTDDHGNYRLTNLPAGHFVVKAWIDSRTTQARPVDLKSGATQHVDFP